MWLTSTTSASADSDCSWAFRKPDQCVQSAVAPFRISLGYHESHSNSYPAGMLKVSLSLVNLEVHSALCALKGHC